jgi:hypothetical protein
MLHALLNQISFRVDVVPVHAKGPVYIVQFVELLFDNPVLSPVRSEALLIWHDNSQRFEDHDVLILL